MEAQAFNPPRKEAPAPATTRTPRTPPDSWVQTQRGGASDGNGKPGTLLSSMLNKTPIKASRQSRLDSHVFIDCF